MLAAIENNLIRISQVGKSRITLRLVATPLTASPYAQRDPCHLHRVGSSMGEDENAVAHNHVRESFFTNPERFSRHHVAFPKYLASKRAQSSPESRVMLLLVWRHSIGTDERLSKSRAPETMLKPCARILLRPLLDKSRRYTTRRSTWDVLINIQGRRRGIRSNVVYKRIRMCCVLLHATT